MARTDGDPIVRDDANGDDDKKADDDEDDVDDAAAATEAAFPLPEMEDMGPEEREALMIDHFWKAAVYEPTFIDAHRALVMLLIKVGDRQKRQEDAEAAREAAGEAVVSARSSFWRSWPFEEAIAAARAAIAVEPIQPALQRELGASLEAAVVGAAVTSVEGESYLVLGGGGGRVSGALSRTRLEEARRAYITSLRADPRDERCSRGVERIEGIQREERAARAKQEAEEDAAAAAAYASRHGHAEL